MIDHRNEKVIKILNYFWFGFILYTVSYSLTQTGYVNFVIFQSFQIIGLLIFIPAALYLCSWKFDNESLRVKFIFLSSWTVIIIVRGLEFNYYSIKYLFVDAYDGIFSYLVPLVLLFSKDLSFTKKLFNIIVILSVIYLVLDVIFINDIYFVYGRNIRSQAIVEVFSKTLSIPCGFILLTYLYHTKKRIIFSLIIILITFVISIIRARRGLGFMALSILAATYFIYFSLNKRRLLSILISIIFVVMIVFFAIYSFTSNKSGTFNYFNERRNEETRKGVEECFYNDMRFQDWIIGRGINGTYYCPGVDEGFGGLFLINRPGIESDYLNIILKGGIISLGLLLIIAIPAAIKGIFYSNNLLSKASGIWILLYLKDLYPSPVTDFTLNYILVWVSIGICYSKFIREKTDSEIKTELYPNLS